MAIRQYIGARYTPRFCGEWNNTTQYEALDVVDNGMGTSYIARKNVPAGTALTNTEYWFVYGASSGAIIDIQNRLSKLENTNFLKDRYFLLVGDSLAYGLTPSDTSSHKGWAEWCVDFIEAAGGRAFYSATTGGGFAVPSAKWEDLLKANDDIAAIKDDITDVILLGGSNDTAANVGSESALNLAISSFFNWSYNYFPKAVFKVGILSAVGVALARDTAKTVNCYRSVRQYGAIYLADLENLANNRSWMDTDATHLTQAGYQTISPYVFECIVTNHTSYHFQFNVTGVPVYNTRDNTQTISVQFNYNEDGCDMIMRSSSNTPLYLDLNSTDTTNVGPNKIMKIATLPKNIPILNGGYVYSTGSASIAIRDTQLNYASYYGGEGTILIGPSFNQGTDNTCVDIMFWTPNNMLNWKQDDVLFRQYAVFGQYHFIN